MLEQRKLKLDLAALGLLALTAFLALALWSYDPADPPSRLVHPPREVPLNMCGPAGAWAAQILLSALGLAAYGLVFSLGVVFVMFFARRQVSDPGLRITGALVALCGLSTVAAMAMPDWTPGPVIGAGGYLGATGRGLLEMNFATVGAYVVVVSFILGGLLLASDYLVIRTLALPLRIAGRSARFIFLRPRSKPRRRRADEDNEDDEIDDELEDEDECDEEYEEEDEEVAVRIVGESGDDELDEEDEDAGSGGPGRRRVGRLAAALGIGRNGSKKSERQKVLEELEAASQAPETFDYEIPPLDLLLESDPVSFEQHKKEVRRKAKILEKTFASFGYSVKVVAIETGPVIAQFEVQLETGLRLNKITGLADDLAIALRVPTVRVVAPIPGKNTVGVEVPNSERQLVRLREVIEEVNGRVQKMRIPIFLGKDVSGNPLVFDLTTMPHLLIAGRTGTGKSVCLNTMIMSILMTRRPEDVRLLLIDPKMVELSPYMKLPHLMHPVVTDMKKAEAILAWAVEKMEERYQLLVRAGVRHISVYNQLGEEELYDRLEPETDEEREQIPIHLPYIVVVADEIADLMMTAPKEVESHIIRLAQKSRAVGIHLVLATQKPTVDVITGLIKSNLPARISFQVASRTDSRVVLDEMGADRLLGDGDLLFLWPGTSTVLRGQGAFVSDDEISRVVEYVGTSEPQFVHELVHLPVNVGSSEHGRMLDRDDLYETAVEIVIREQRGSVSLLQRTLGIGYGRAARLIDYMAEDGIVGEYNGSQAREVLASAEDWERISSGGQRIPAPAKTISVRPIRPPRNRILPAPHDEEDREPRGRRTPPRPARIGAHNSPHAQALDLGSLMTAEEEDAEIDDEQLVDAPRDELTDEYEAEDEASEEDEELVDEAEDLEDDEDEEELTDEDEDEEEDEEPHDEADDELEEDEEQVESETERA